MRLLPLKSLFTFLVIIFCFGALATAETLTGTVTNGTSNKPGAGDEVVLLKLSQGMEEGGRTKADAKGKFSFNLDDAGAPHLIRVIHQGVTYHRMAPPGSTSVEVSVYDVSKKIDALSVTADVMRFQAQGNELQGIRLFAVNNSSEPPRTQMNDQNFEFYLPDGAVVDSADAQTSGGQPLNTSPVPQKQKNRYAFIFPLRPGETQFQVVFHMPYSGKLNVDPKPLYGTQHFVVMLPKSMQFAAGPGTAFQSMKDPRQSDAVVQVASNTQVGQSLGFSISGTGLLSQPQADAQGTPQPAGPEAAGDQASSGAASTDMRPGGGLGPPIDAPDPLDKYRWPILGGFLVLLAGGAIFISRRQPRSARAPDFAASDIDGDLELPSIPRKPGPPKAASLLDALKEELFQLEVEHKQGHITQQEYQKAKAALDHTLERAIKRESAGAR